MDPGRVLEVLEILDAVLAPEARPGVSESVVADRSARLDELCGDDAELRREVERLLALETDAGDFLDTPAVDLTVAAEESETPERLGPYRLLEILGRGGMGTVYLAVREDDFEKQVALKVLRRELVFRDMVRRFHAERQILAGLEHPGIAHLLDGGALPDGRPYLVMEYVDGLPVDRYCAEHSLGVRERLELFRRIAEAVAFAHRNLIVHRDVKPNNVLVTADGVPKLLDFGIAKLLEPMAEAPMVLPEGGKRNVAPEAGKRNVAPEAGERNVAPEAGERNVAPEAGKRGVTTPTSQPMTPRYASPEQIAGDTVTTAGDVYALGLLLYQMLTGKLPCGLSDCPAPDVPRLIREQVPETPSRTAWVADGGTAFGLRIDADVDAIVLKALRKDPAERYTSAEQMATDVGRYLRHLPVRARRGTWLYFAAKRVRRRPWATVAVALFVAFSVTSTVLWREAVGERQRARSERLRADHERAAAVRQQARAERVSSFLKDLFRSADPDAGHGGRRTVREVLAEGRTRLATGLEHEPELEAVLAGTLGDVYRNLGLHEEAVELLKRSVDLRRQLYPEGDPRLAVALNDLGSVFYYMERYAQAEAYMRESLALRRRLGDEPSAIAQALNNLATTLKQQDELAVAGELYAEALAIREAVYGKHDKAVASSLYSLGALRLAEGDLETAEPLLRRALEIYLAAHGEKHTRVASLLATLGRLLHTRGELDEAEDLLRRSLAVRRELLGDDNAQVTSSRESLDAVLAAVE